MASAFGGQRSIQLSYGCMFELVADPQGARKGKLGRRDKPHIFNGVTLSIGLPLGASLSSRSRPVVDCGCTRAADCAWGFGP